MTILELQRIVNRTRDLSRTAFLMAKVRDANLYAAKEASEQLAQAFENYVSEIRKIAAKRITP
jgi:hypothetical protein